MHRYPSRPQPGQVIGLLGGSFDPPHGGHLHISRWAERALDLSGLWWLVSPGNPLKADGPAPIAQRLEACRELTRGSGIHVSDIEVQLGWPFTANTLLYLKNRYPRVRFVWLMGADNLSGFHHWQRWTWIIETVPMAVLARPGQQVRAGLSLAAQRYRHLRLPPTAAGLLGRTATARWALLPGPMSDQSSTAIRQSGGWVKGG
ncbi:MAG: nicotinate-nucleotide adenylyltransferase [Pseudomonadota bacterium]